MLNRSAILAGAVTSFRHMYTCLANSGHPIYWWIFSFRDLYGQLKWRPVQDLSYCIMTAVNFQGTPLTGGYVTLDGCVGGWCGFGEGRSF